MSANVVGKFTLTTAIARYKFDLCRKYRPLFQGIEEGK